MKHDIKYHFTLVLSGVDENTPGLEIRYYLLQAVISQA